MSRNRILIEDPYEEIPGTTMQERLEKYEMQKQIYSTQREEEWINQPSTLFNIVDNICDIKNKLSQKFSKLMKQR